MRFQRHGISLNVFDQGGIGIPVIFQHGLCGGASQTREAFPPNPRYRLITLECRGHGLSEPGPVADFSIATFADDLAAFMRAQKLGPTIIGGISMGAAIAQNLAVHHPSLVRALVLVRPAWMSAAAPANCRPNAEVGQLLQDLTPAEARDRFMASDTASALQQTAPDNLASLLGFFTRESHHITAALLTAIANDGPGTSEAELASITVPTLVIGHGRDAIHPLACARELCSLIPGAALAEITPKATSKAQYLADLHGKLLQFFDKVYHP